jgi:hypothetical protein
VLPSTAVTVGQDALSILRFQNQGTSNASHVTLESDFTPSIGVRSTTLAINGSVVSPNNCVSADIKDASGNTVGTSVRCADIGSINGGQFAKLITRFSSSAVGRVQAVGHVFYGESGNDNTGGPNGTVNDNQTSNTAGTTFVAAATGTGPVLQSGKCTSPAAGATDSVAGADAAMAIGATYAAAIDTLLPCTPAAAGIVSTIPPGLHTETAFVDFPAVGGLGYGVAKVDFTPLPAGFTLKSLVLHEALSGTDFSNSIAVPSCLASGLPPNAGFPPLPPPSGSTGNAQNDTCIADRSPLPKGGGELTLHVLGSPSDGHYAG